MQWEWNSDRTEAKATTELGYVRSNGEHAKTIVIYRVACDPRVFGDAMAWRVMRRVCAFNHEHELFRDASAEVAQSWAETNASLYREHGHLLLRRARMEIGSGRAIEPHVPWVDTCIEHGPGGTIRLPFQIRVF